MIDPLICMRLYLNVTSSTPDGHLSAHSTPSPAGQKAYPSKHEA